MASEKPGLNVVCSTVNGMTQKRIEESRFPSENNGNGHNKQLVQDGAGDSCRVGAS